MSTQMIQPARSTEGLAISGVNAVLSTLANRLSQDAEPAEIVRVTNILTDWASVIADIVDVAKLQILSYLQTKGERVTDKGTLRAEVNSWIIEARPTRTGLDSKKVEALLRAKGLLPEMGMDVQVTYAANEGKLNDLVRTNRISPDELQTCKYDLKYSVQKPKQAKEFTNEE